VLCFDSDNAGQTAATRVLDSLLAAGLAIRVATVPAGHDPDSLIRERGGDAFRQFINEAEGFFDFFLNRLCTLNDPQTDRGRVAIVHDMGEALHKTRSAVLLDTYAQKTAYRLGVSPEAVRDEFRKAGRVKLSVYREEDSEISEDPEAEATVEIAPPSEREFWLLRFLLLHDDQMDWLARHLDLAWIQHPTVKRIIASRIAAHASHNWRGIPGLIDDLDDNDASALVTEAVAEEYRNKKNEGEKRSAVLAHNIVEAVQELRSTHIERQLAANKIRLNQPGLSTTDAEKILRENIDLGQLKQTRLEIS